MSTYRDIGSILGSNIIKLANFGTITFFLDIYLILCRNNYIYINIYIGSKNFKYLYSGHLLSGHFYSVQVVFALDRS